MSKLHRYIILCFSMALATISFSQAVNPVIHADVPDLSMIRVGDTYYMSSTTMHMSPGLPIMKSKDLINWQLLNYAYDTLVSNDALNLEKGSNAYGRGSWASCIRYHKGMYYVSTFSATSGKTHVYRTKNIEKGDWKENTFTPSYHDHTIFFDDDGKVYMIYAAGKLKILELKPDLTGVMPGTEERVLIENASAPAGDKIMLGAEGSQLFKVNGKYYLFNITWPRGGMRTVVIHRADNINGPWEGRVGLQDLGVAQGGLIETPNGKWYAYLFRDNGGVGRIPYLVPVKWEDGWPVLGIDGKVPMTLDLPASKGLIPNLVHSDEFTRKRKDKPFSLAWQWNHNPDNKLWSLKERKGYLRLRTGRVDTSFVSAKNTLTQRTIGPECTGSTMLDASGMKEGDFAGLALLQKNFGQVGIKIVDGKKVLTMVKVDENLVKEVETIALNQNVVYLKAVCDFKERADLAHFQYSLDGIKWMKIGTEFKMPYTLPHFMGYRFGLYNYATESIGGHADFDFFHIKPTIN